EFAVDVVPETLRRTNLGELGPGDPVNLERALAFGDRVGGHLVQGHVDEAGRITAIDPDGDALMVRFQAQATLMQYVVEKGFVAVDGVSLTVVECGVDWFTVTLIPVTRANTVLGSKKVGDRVNLESDILAKYVRRQLQGLSPE
ncbi:MAG: riboflavin synthase, partial [Chloroflexi bacterium]|nr:riboflavin synthase [Chloroflexota bacterium]